MPETDLSPIVPLQATWVKLHYEMKAIVPGTELLTRLWSGSVENAVPVRGHRGEVFVKLRSAQRLSYEKPAGVELKLKVVSYKRSEGED